MISGSSSGQIRQRFSLACLVYRSQCVIAMQRRVNLWKRTSRVTRVTIVLWIGNETLRLLPSSSHCRQRPFRHRNLRSKWRVRQYKDGDVRTLRTASANELAWFYKGFRESVHPEGVPNASYLCSVPFPIRRTRVTRVTRDVFLKIQNLYTSFYVYCVRLTKTCHSTCMLLLFCWLLLMPSFVSLFG